MLKTVGLAPTPHKRDQESNAKDDLNLCIVSEIQTPNESYRTWRHNLLNLLAKFKLRNESNVPTRPCLLRLFCNSLILYDIHRLLNNKLRRIFKGAS